MATPYSDVYDKFATMFKDKSLANLTQPTLESLFDTWLDESVSVHFTKCRQDLSDRNEIAKQFNQTLTSQEQWIIAYGMQLSWLDSKLYDYEGKLKGRFNDRDFSTYSPAQLLTSIRETQESTRKKYITALNRYIKAGLTYNYL